MWFIKKLYLFKKLNGFFISENQNT